MASWVNLVVKTQAGPRRGVCAVNARLSRLPWGGRKTHARSLNVGFPTPIFINRFLTKKSGPSAFWRLTVRPTRVPIYRVLLGATHNI